MPQQPGWTPVASAAPTPSASGWTLVKAASPEPDPATWWDSASNFVANFSHKLDPRPALGLLYDAAFHPMRLKEANAQASQAQIDQFHQAKKAYDAGRWSEAVGHTFAGMLPSLGPQAADAGEQIASGDISGGLGSAAGMIAPFAVGPAVSKLSTSVKAALPPMQNPNPVQASAVSFGRAQGIPIDAATATGSKFLATAQKAVSDSIGGAGTAERFQRAQAQGLATVGDQLAAKGSPLAPQTAESAGTGAIKAVDQHIGNLQAKADAAYGQLRAIEQKQPIPVDLRGVKKALEPIYRTLAVGADIAPLQGAKGSAVRALARILEGPDVAGLSEADSALSDLKSLARGAAIPELRSVGQGTAAEAVKQVEGAVQQAVQAAGPQAVKALDAGRRATTAKYAAADVRDFLTGNTSEPVQAYGRMVAREDTNIARVRQAAKIIPGEMPKIGRAFLEDLMESAKADGSFDKARTIATNWDKLGPETKSLLFPDAAHVAALDDFFQLAKKIGENPNPSGSGKMVNFYNPAQWIAALPMYALSKLFYTPAGVRLLTDGFRVPVQSPAAIAAYGARLNAAVVPYLNPATAADNPKNTTPSTVRR